MPITKINKGKHVGEWRVRVQPRNPQTGNKVNIPVEYAKTKKKAQEIERKLKADFENGFTYEDANNLFYESFNKFIELEYKRGRWELGTYKDWQYSERIFKKYFANVKIKSMNQDVVHEFARSFVKDNELTIGRDSVIDRRLSHMRAFFKNLVGKSVRTNPVPPRALEVFFRKDEKAVKKEKYILSNDEAKQLKSVIYNDIQNKSVSNWVTRIAILIGIETGMRPQEIQALKWDSLYEDNEHLVFRISDSWNQSEKKFNGHLKARKKNEFRLTLPISVRLQELLNKYKHEQNDYLFENNVVNHNNLIFLNLNDYRICALGYPVAQASFNEMLKQTAKSAKIKIPDDKKWSMYSLRHTCATKLASTPGMSYPWAADRLGHTLKEFMETYVHVDRDVSKSMLEKWID